MSQTDARQLSPAAQEDLRRRVMRAVDAGMSISEAARTFDVSRQAIYNWKGRVAASGQRGLKSQRRGRPPGTQLRPNVAATTVRMILGSCPDQLRLPFALWTREAVQLLLKRRFGVEVSVWTVGRYLRRWNLTPQKPMQRAFEQDPAAVRHWLQTEYPAIRAAAKVAGAEIWWGDEMGLRSDHQTGTSYGRRGQTPVIPGTGQRFGCNMISALTNRGSLAFMVFEGSFNVNVFLKFLKRLLRQAKRKVFLIVDRLRVHRATAVQAWVESQGGRIRIDYLPAYSPQLNPDEILNHDVKSNAIGRRRAATKTEMKAGLRGYLRSTQRQPHIVRNFFQESHVQYAAA
jgi:transposase